MMKKNIFILFVVFIFCLLVSNSAYSQTAIAWQKSIGGSGADFGKWICKAPAGEFYLGGYTNSDDGDISGVIGGMDVYVIRFDSNGVIKWQKNYGGTGNDYIHGLLSTSDGGALIKGYTLSSDLPGYKAGFDIWLVKIDENGLLEWQQTYGGSDDDGLHAVDVQEHPKGGYIMTASSESDDGDISSNIGDGDAWLVRLSSTGAILWEKSFGGTADEDMHCIIISSDTGYIVAGHTSSDDGDVSGLHSSGFDDAWIFKTDSSGNLLWQVCLGGSGTELFKYGCKVNGGYVFAGYSNSNDGDVPGNNGDVDGWVVKIDESGNIVWSRNIGGSQGDYINSVMQGNNGSIIISGLSNSNDGDFLGNNGDYDYFIFVLDSLGSIMWQRSLGGAALDRGEFAFQSSPTSWMITGFSNSTSGDITGNQGLFDAWTVKLQDCSWINSSFNYSPSSVCVNDLVSVTNTSVYYDSVAWYINGNYYSSVNEPDFVFYQSEKDSVMLVVFSGACSDTSYHIIDVKPLPLVDLGSDMSICSGCSVFLDAGNPGASYLWSTGETTGIITFSQAPDTVSVIVTLDGCVAYDTIFIDLDTYVGRIIQEGAFVFPNPAEDVIFIDYPCATSVKYKIFAVNGAVLLSGLYDTPKFNIDITSLSKGFYMLELIINESIYRSKVIKR